MTSISFPISFFFFILVAARLQMGEGYAVRIENSEALRNLDDSLTATCVSCSAGSFSGSFSVDGKKYNCSRYCPHGFCPIGIKCNLCQAGTYSSHPNSSFCLRCAPGRVSQNITGSVDCNSCQLGYTNNSDSTKCVACLPGFFSDDPAIGCLSCPAGYFSKGPAATGCDECPSGTFNSIPGQLSCSPCGSGKYNPSAHSNSPTACLVCPGGYYCPSSETSTPVSCPAGYYCPGGTSNPNSCPLLFQSDKSSESCQPEATLYLLLLGGVAALVAVVAVVICVRAGRNKPGPESKSKQPTESDRLIPQSRDGPVYEGL